MRYVNVHNILLSLPFRYRSISITGLFPVPYISPSKPFTLLIISFSLSLFFPYPLAFRPSLPASSFPLPILSSNPFPSLSFTFLHTSFFLPSEVRIYKRKQIENVFFHFFLDHYSFSWSLSWSRACFLDRKRVFLFSYFPVSFHKFPPLLRQMPPLYPSLSSILLCRSLPLFTSSPLPCSLSFLPLSPFSSLPHCYFRRPDLGLTCPMTTNNDVEDGRGGRGWRGGRGIKRRTEEEGVGGGEGRRWGG